MMQKQQLLEHAPVMEMIFIMMTQFLLHMIQLIAKAAKSSKKFYVMAPQEFSKVKS
ncbi:hypothetical protein D3C87_2086820 [compost metagenome]